MFDISKPALHSFLTMALKHTSTQGELQRSVIILSYVDSGYLDMAENFFISFKKFGIDNYIFVSSSNATVKELNKRGMRGVAVWEEDNAFITEPSDFGSPGFAYKVVRKIPLGDYWCVWMSAKFKIMTFVHQ